MWMPDELPYFVKPDRVWDLTLRCPASATMPVDRVEENVPIIRERVTCRGLPADPLPGSSSKGPVPEEHDPLEGLNLDDDPPASSDPVPEHVRRRRAAKEAARPAHPEGPAAREPEGLRLKPDPLLPKFV